MSTTKNLSDFKIEQKTINGVQVFETSYQPINDSGQPVGTRTFLRASSQEKLLEKIAESHANAVNYAQRLQRKLTSPTTQPKRMSDIERAELGKRVAQGDPDALDSLVTAKLRESAEVEAEQQRQYEEARKFCSAHPEYVQNQANSQVILAELNRLGIGFDLAAIEVAFGNVRDKLALQNVADNSSPTPSPAAADSKGATNAQLGISENPHPFTPLLDEAQSLTADALKAKLRNPAWAAQFEAQLALHNEWVQKNKATRAAHVAANIMKRIENQFGSK